MENWASATDLDRRFKSDCHFAHAICHGAPTGGSGDFPVIKITRHVNATKSYLHFDRFAENEATFVFKFLCFLLFLDVLFLSTKYSITFELSHEVKLF